MPHSRLIFFRAADGEVPMRSFLREMRNYPGAYRACWAAIEKLRDDGRDLSRVLLKPLGNGIWELRIHAGRVQIRILLAFVGAHVILLTQGITKEGAVPPAEIERAVEMVTAFMADPETHGA